MNVQLVEAVDADQVYRLACEYYADDLHLTIDELVQSLRAADAEFGNFSVALVDHGEMQAYLLAWLEESRVEGNRESVVLVDDVVAEPDLLSRLFRAMVDQLEDQGFAHLAIEGTILPATRSLFGAQKRLFRTLGYELVASHDYFDEDLEIELTWVRYERPVEVEASVNDDVEFSSDDSEFLA